MAFLQGLAQAAAAGFQGDQLLTELNRQKQALRIDKAQADKTEEDRAAEKLWAGAVSDVLQGTQTQTPGITPPVAPQPGSTVTPGGPPTGTPPAPASGAPGAPPPNPALAVLQGGGAPGGQPPAAAPTPMGQPPQPTGLQKLDATSILQRVVSQNANLPPGVLASVVDNHILPLLDAQSKQQFEMFKQQIEFYKLNADQQDKMLMLYFHYDQMHQVSLDRQASTAERAQAAAEMNQTRLLMAQLAAQGHADARQAQQDKLAEQKRVDALKPLEAKLRTLTSQQNAAENMGDKTRVELLQKQIDDTQIKMDDLNSGGTSDTGGGQSTDTGGGSMPQGAIAKAPDGTPDGPVTSSTGRKGIAKGGYIYPTQ